MFLYQGLFLMMLIFSSARILLADIFVPNGYKDLSQPNPQYKPIPRQMMPLSDQDGQQLVNEQWMQYPYYTMYPYYTAYQDQPSNLVGYHPYHPYHHYHHHPSYYNHYSLPRPTDHLHYTKIGGHEYTRPSVFLGYPNPLAVHYRYKRSDKADPTNSDSNKSAVTTNDDVVATESPVSETKHSTSIDSVLPENESTDTNNKHVENRQSKNEHVIKPLLLGLYPEKMYHGHRQTRERLLQENTPENHDKQVLTFAEVKPTQQTISKQDQETSSINHEPVHFIRKPTENLEQSSNLNAFRVLIPSQSQGLSEKELTSHSNYNKYYNKYYDKFYPTMLSKSIYRPKYSKKYNSEEEAEMYPIIQEKYISVRQQGANQEQFNKEYSQEMTNINEADKATSGGNRVTVLTPCPDYEPILESTRESITNNNNNVPPGEGVVTATTSAPCVACTQYRNNGELLRTNEIIRHTLTDPLYSDRINMPLAMQVSYDFTNYNLNDWDEYSKEASDIYSDFDKYINFAHTTPVSLIKIPDYVLNTNLNAKSNPIPTTYAASILPVTPQVQRQYFSTYNYPTERTYNPYVYNYYYYPNSNAPLSFRYTFS